MNYSFSGAGTIPGGEYDKVRVSGAAKLAGDVRCSSFSASGALGGSGSIVCSGPVHVSGSTSVDGPVTAGELKASGAFKCKGLSGKDLHTSGSIRVDGDMEADSIHVSGSVNCSGLVNADYIEIKQDGVCRAGSIGGSKIDIRPGASTMNGLSRIFGKGGKFARFEVAEAIEGDDVYLENVSCPAVTGRRVTIGPGCSIGSVQYSQGAEISPDARVDSCQQV